MSASQKAITSSDRARRAGSSVLKDTAGYSTSIELTNVEVRPDGKTLVVLRIKSDESAASSARIRGFSERDVRDLTALAKLDPSPDVRQAATAVLLYAQGASLESCAAGTPYGIGWVRGLLKVVHREGVRSLQGRKYRRSRRKTAEATRVA